MNFVSTYFEAIINNYALVLRNRRAQGQVSSATDARLHTIYLEVSGLYLVRKSLPCVMDYGTRDESCAVPYEIDRGCVPFLSCIMIPVLKYYFKGFRMRLFSRCANNYKHAKRITLVLVYTSGTV